LYLINLILGVAIIQRKKPW